MTTGATGQLGLALPVQGELSGTWGDTVNNGITQYTNIAIAGTLTLTNDGAVTLANTTGDASASNITSSLTGAGTVTAQFAIVKVTGTLTTAKVVTGPSYSKTYTVVNSATGGIVTFKASGQTGVSIAVGETAFVYYNGTDYVKVVGTATAGAAGGSNTQVQFNSSGVLAGDADLTFDGTTLTANALTVTNAVTLSGGTANGVAYLNGSKVVTSGSALTFDGSTLGVANGSSGTAGISITGTYSGSGTVAFLNFQRAGGAVAGTLGYNDASTAIQFGTTTNHSTIFLQNNSEAMRLTSTGLGIGTSSPGTKLDVVGAIRASVASGNSAININNSSLTGKAWDLLPSTSSGESDLLWYYGGASAGTRMTLTNTGNLVIGTTPPANTVYPGLFLAYGVSLTGYAGTTLLSYNSYNVGTQLKYIGNDAFGGFRINGNTFTWINAASGTANANITDSEQMRLNSTGLGIGTSSPSVKLETSTARSATVVSAIFSETGTGAVNDVNKLAIKVVNTLGGATGGAAIGAVLEASASNRTGLALYYDSGSGTQTEGFRLDSLGNVGIGTSTPAAVTGFSSNRVVTQITSSSGYGQLRLGGNAGTMIDHDNGGTTATTIRNLYGATSNDAAMLLESGYIAFKTGTSYTERMRVTGAGNVGIGTSSPPTKLGVYVPNSTGPVLTLGGADGVGNVTGVRIGYGEGGSYCKSAVLFENTDGAYATGSLHLCVDTVADSGNATIADAKLTIDSSGNVGIGITNPTAYSAKLNVAGNISASAGNSLRVWESSNVTYVQMNSPSSRTIRWVNDAAEEYMRLTSGGNLLVGTTSGSQRLVVSKNDSGAYVGYFENTTGSNANGVLISTPNRAGSNGLYGLTVANSGGNAFAIYTDGTYGTISDINRKKNVETARNGYLTDLCALRVVKYNWKEQEDSEPKNIGFIAQEVEQVFPGMVQTDSNGQKMLTQPILIPMLVKAIQELKAEFDAYKASHP
jgi:hypothetical protein